MAKYTVHRTSDFGQRNGPPCNGAKKQKVDGCDAWVVEIDDLLDFAREHRRIVVHCEQPGKIQNVEIYDDYRE